MKREPLPALSTASEVSSARPASDPSTATSGSADAVFEFEDPGVAPLRILIVAESASAMFGGEAALPLHYYRVLKKRGVPVWLLTHARTRRELSALYPGDSAIRYVEDTAVNRAMWAIGKRMPPRLSYFTAGFASRLATQMAQRRIARKLVADERIDVVHQPMPVSPCEPSLMYGLGAPVVIGPMNGGMNYPPGFGRRSGRVGTLLMRVGRANARLMNKLMPGKRRASLLLVANQRTRDALPKGVCGHVVELVENGVDLAVWRAPEVALSSANCEPRAVRFVYLGRLIELKAVDMLLEAFHAAAWQASMELVIAGDGAERPRLEALAESLGLLGKSSDVSASVTFTGWLSQAACALRLREADCLILPSLLECGGAVVLEAMAMGKPVIATKWGGPVDYLDASCGILVPPTDRASFVSGLCSAMVRLAMAPNERAEMGASGRRKVQCEFDWEVKGARMLALYRSACTRRLP